MRITIHFDYACPYCYIGTHKLKRMLTDCKAMEKASFKLKAFRLNREGTDFSQNEKCGQYYQKKYSLTNEQAQAEFEKLNHIAAKEGLEIHYPTAPVIDTTTPIRVTKYALEKLGGEGALVLAEVLFRAYQVYNMDISNPEILIGFAVNAGLDAEGVKQVIESDEYGPEVLMDEMKAGLLDIHVIPDVTFNDKYHLKGIRPDNEVRDLVMKVLSEDRI
ncbi:MAG: DsbA family protein [Lachnospiraceae bacterium]|nr:DsbA family protein [Lachnospiraceae bacterium]